jgi:hypothetical protein
LAIADQRFIFLPFLNSNALPIAILYFEMQKYSYSVFIQIQFYSFFAHNTEVKSYTAVMSACALRFRK